MSTTCNLVVIRSSNLDKAELFYSALGLKFTRHSHGGPVHLVSDSVGLVFEIYPIKEPKNNTSSTRIGFLVKSTDLAYTAALNAGGKTIVAPTDSEWGRRAVVEDSDGHKVEILSHEI